MECRGGQVGHRSSVTRAEAVRPACGLVTPTKPACGRIGTWIASKSSCSGPSRSATCASCGCRFTDVLGTLKSVAVASAELEGASQKASGSTGRRSKGSRECRSGHARPARPDDVPSVPWRGESPAPRACSPTADDGSAVRRPAAGAAGRALWRAGRPRFHLLYEPGGRVLPVRVEPEEGPPAEAGRPPATSTSCPKTTAPSSGGRRSASSSRWVSRWSSPPRGRARPERIDLRYADTLTMADNIMTFRTSSKKSRSRRGSTRRSCRSRSQHAGSGMHTHMSLFEGEPTRSTRRGRVPPEQDRPEVHRRAAHARRRDHRRHQPVDRLLQAL